MENQFCLWRQLQASYLVIEFYNQHLMHPGYNPVTSPLVARTKPYGKPVDDLIWTKNKIGFTLRICLWMVNLKRSPFANTLWEGLLQPILPLPYPYQHTSTLPDDR